ncbi:MAG: GNAT family N-acetyltransferase [Vicinamibacterales bacterium]
MSRIRSPALGVCPRPHTPSGRSVTIRALTTVEEFAACVEVQRTVWGWSDLDLMPVRLFVLLQHVGGLVLGAWEDAALVGFVNCVPGAGDGHLYWHSHMMAVLPAFQDRGIGTALKLAQRQHALDRGVSAVQWVFDPLQAKNAHLNLVKLGAVVRHYSINHYGASSSPLHAGFDSDRVVAEWRLAGAPLRFGDETRRIGIPADIQQLKRIRPSEVRPMQLAVRAAFLEHVADGFVASGFERHGDSGTYILRRQLDAVETDTTTERMT